MMSKAVSKYNRISPKKARLLTRPLMGKTVAEAYALLGTANKRAARFIGKVLKSAFYNARRKNPAVTEGELYISKIVADSGPSLKRYRAASMGRASNIIKRTSHFTVHLEAREISAAAKEAAKAPAKKRTLFKKKTGATVSRGRRKLAAGRSKH